jgi:hypothetical protein
VLLIALVVGLIAALAQNPDDVGTALLVVPFVLLLLAVLLASMLVSPPVLALAALLGAARHSRRRRAADARAGVGATIPAPRPAGDPTARWRRARERFDTLRGEYGAYECDPLAVLRLPALADVTVPATARFVDAFAEAQALDSEAQPPAEHLAAFERAVDRACRAWRAARDAADRIRLAGLSPEERATVARVTKLLAVAERSGHDAERIAAYAKAREELGKLERSGHLHLPRPAAAALEHAARPGLPA